MEGTLLVMGSRDGKIRIAKTLKRRTEEKVLVGHSDWVTSVAVSDSAKLIVSGSDDRTLRLWDAASGEPVGAPHRGHEDGISCVTISDDGKRMLSASLDSNLKMWELKGSSEVEEEAPGSGAAVVCVAIKQDAKYAVSASSDRTLRMWNVVIGEAIRMPVVFLMTKLEVSSGVLRAYGEGGLKCWEIDGDKGLVKESTYNELLGEELCSGESAIENEKKMWDTRCSGRKVMGTWGGWDGRRCAAGNTSFAGDPWGLE